MIKGTGKKQHCYFRIGTYGVMQIPRNHVVGELSIRPNGEEYIIGSSKTFHKNFDSALVNLYDRLLSDKAHQSTLNSVKGLIELIKESKEELLQAIQEQDITMIENI